MSNCARFSTIMITADEIKQKSKETAIQTSDIQRDYLFGWLLFYLFTKSKFKEILFLKGGNALRKAYFVNTRFSGDLDFGTPHDLDLEELKQELTAACAFINEQTEITFVIERNDVVEKFGKWKETRWKVFEAKIYFKDFFGKSDHITLKISLDITRFDKHYLPIQTVPLIHPYSDSDSIACNIRCMKLEEVLATKLKCMLQREHAPDLFDLIFSIYMNQNIPIDKSEVRRVFLQRTIFENNPSVVKNILLKLPLEYLKATWTKALICTQDIFFDAEDAVKRFTEQITEMFQDVTDNPWSDHYYFGADHRNAILKAGREMTLLRVTYNGAVRMVEPYALKFQERSDGVAKEYFYVYDRTGSKNNPDWKTFVAENLSAIENTDEKFEPQFEVELCRAGEHPEDRYLYDREKKQQKEYARVMRNSTRFGSSSVQTRKPRAYAFGPKYVFKCSVCGKQFTRKTYNASLGQHKSKSGGYPCYGYGIYVTTRY
ncbi:MAG: nucleotidyl transferase AbiEii/AbiGii toxin family protein [Candidatus Taylorbacteria bacterium]|nr:nucleotidyl transferase AbiEii/AbiGii toxin family protein [Candidatus Taylorbacteria bacterium]